MEHETALRAALSEDGDIELRFQSGHSIPGHSLKLKLTSSVLKDMITATLDDTIRSLQQLLSGGRLQMGEALQDRISHSCWSACIKAYQ